MKARNFILAVVFVAVVSAAFADLIIFGGFSTVNNSTTVPAQLTNTSVFVKGITLIGKHGRTTNATTVWIGLSSTDGTQEYAVDPGAQVIINAQPLHWLDLSNWWYDVTTAGDGLTVFFY